MAITEQIFLHKKALLVLLFIVCVLGYVTYSFTAPGGRFADVQNDLKSISPDDAHAYTDVHGNVVHIRDFRGKPLVVNSWATWTPFSQTELPLLAQYAERYKNDIHVLAINRMESAGVVRSYMSTFAIPDTITILLDPMDTFYTAVSGYAMPETVLYDADGNIVHHIRGTISVQKLDELLATLLHR